MSNRGPRVIQKPDAESRIGRGCVEYGAHYRPEIAIMTWAACAAARDVDPLIAFCRKTEGDRPARTGDDGHPRRDLHAELRALDFTFEYDNNVRIDPQLYTEIAFNMRMRLGDDYDVLQHAVGTDALHIHCELDPK